MTLRKDIWRPCIVEATIADVLAANSITGFPRRWLPDMGAFRFLADPFGLWRDGRLYVFAEGYDYRERIGWIEALVFGPDLALIESGPALRERWHLSYPFVFEAEGETWLLPEAAQSGGLTLYRAVDFPYRWAPAHRITLDHVPIDATPLFHDGLWWLFYTSADREADKMAALHVAYADRLAGPWRPHPANPVRHDIAAARPGGTPFAHDGGLVLPVQDCGRTYGGAIRPLRIETLTPSRCVAAPGARLLPPPEAAPFTEGLHTLAAVGRVTLVDMKRTVLSLHGLAIHARERIGRRRRRGMIGFTI